jgi:NAD(P)-dependent dehydrogenase (short-subunit alcohol dehydrogenase family)
VVSQLTGDWLRAADATDVEYWVRQAREPVRFGDGLRTLLATPELVLLEIGPGATLTGLVRQHPAHAPSQPVLHTLPPARTVDTTAAQVQRTLAQLWLAGVEIDWDGVAVGAPGRRVALPSYPFERQRYWLDARPVTEARDVPPLKKLDLADWFYTPYWRQAAPAAAAEAPGSAGRYLLFADECGIGKRLAARLASQGHQVISVSAGTAFAYDATGASVIAPGAREQYETLLTSINGPLSAIIHLWSVTADPLAMDSRSLAQARQLSFDSLLYLAQALGKQSMTAPLRLLIVSNGLHDILGDEPLQPAKALLLGPCNVIPYEYPQISCQSVDITLPSPGSQPTEQVINRLLAELRDPQPEPLIAYRGQHRWLLTLQPERITAAPARPSLLREQGVYLITGGLGGMGLTLAAYLARTVRARLALIGRSALPPRELWDYYLERDDQLGALIRQVHELEQQGAEVLVLRADVADEARMREAISQIHERFGALHGVIHAAGVPSGGVMQLKLPEQIDHVFAPKVAGTLALAAALGECQLDFCILASSLSAMTGEFGQVDYCAANAFLNAFAHFRAGRLGQPTIAINWSVWKDVGMAVKTELPPTLRALRDKDLLERGIGPQEGAAIVARILQQHRQPQIVVSTRALPALFADARRATSMRGFAHELEQDGAAARHTRPPLPTPYVPPSNDTERAIGAVWTKLLGIDQIGVHDHFFELGGTSLIAIQVVAQINKELTSNLPVSSLYDSLTVARLARLIDKEPQEDLLPSQSGAHLAERKQKMLQRKRLHQERRARMVEEAEE